MKGMDVHHLLLVRNLLLRHRTSVWSRHVLIANSTPNLAIKFPTIECNYPISNFVPLLDITGFDLRNCNNSFLLGGLESVDEM